MLPNIASLGADNRSLCNRYLLFYEHQVADDSVGNKDSFAGEPQVVVLQLQLAAPQIGGGHRVAIVGKRLAEAGLECRQVDASAGTQGGHDAFVVAGRRAQFLLLVTSVFFFNCRNIFLQGGDVPFPAARVERMGRRAAAQVGNALPVGRVVARVEAGLAEVGNLVVLVSGGREGVHQGGEETHAAVLVHFVHPMGLQHPIEWGAFLVGQVVGRDVLHVEGDGLSEVALPAFVRFAGQAVDEVDADVVEAVTAATLHGFDGLPGVVASVQQTEGGVVEGLDAHADAVEGQAAEHGCVLLGQVVGIGLKGNLFAVAEAVDIGQGIEDLKEILLLELRRRAASEVDGTDGLALQVVATQGELFAQGPDVALPEVVARGGVEVAIDAPRLAERYVDVDACHVCFLA